MTPAKPLDALKALAQFILLCAVFAVAVPVILAAAFIGATLAYAGSMMGRGEVSEWKPIETVPRDGRYILAIVAPNDSRHLGHQAGRVFVIRHEGKTAHSGYDMGWAVYPGFGGAPDGYFTHWMPLPAPPAAPGRKA